MYWYLCVVLSIVYDYPSRMGPGYQLFLVLSCYSFMPLCIDICVLYCLLSMSIPIGWGRVIKVFCFKCLCRYAFMYWYLCVVLFIVYVYPSRMGPGYQRFLCFKVLRLYAFMYWYLCVVLSIVYVYPRMMGPGYPIFFVLCFLCRYAFMYWYLCVCCIVYCLLLSQ